MKSTSEFRKRDRRYLQADKVHFPTVKEASNVREVTTRKKVQLPVQGQRKHACRRVSSSRSETGIFSTAIQASASDPKLFLAPRVIEGGVDIILSGTPDESKQFGQSSEHHTITDAFSSKLKEYASAEITNEIINGHSGVDEGTERIFGKHRRTHALAADNSINGFIEGDQLIRHTRREISDLHKKQKRAYKSFFSPIHAPGKRSTQNWVRDYAKDRSTFASRYRWCQAKLVEAQQLVELGALPQHVLIATTAQMVVEMEDRLSFMNSRCSAAVTELLRSIFIFDCAGQPPQIQRAVKLVLERRSGKHAIWYGDGDDNQRERLRLFMCLQTYYGQSSLYKFKLQRELELRPLLEGRMKERILERKKERRLFMNLLDSWRIPRIEKIFEAWRSLLESDAKRNKLARFFSFAHGIKPSHVFQAWKSYWKESKLLDHKEQAGGRIGRLRDLSEKLRRVKANNSTLKNLQGSLRGAIEKVKSELDDALETLHHPARQPAMLLRNLQMMTSVLHEHRSSLLGQLKHGSDDYCRQGLDVRRLAPLYRWKGIRHQPLKEILASQITGDEDLDDESDFDTEVEAMVSRWVPGRFPSEEKTPAFNPYGTRPGHRVVRWLNNTLRLAWASLDPLPSVLGKLELVDNPGKLDGLKYSVLVWYLDGLGKNSDFDEESRKRARSWIDQLLGPSRPEPQHLTRSVLERALGLRNECGRYLETKHITGMEDDPTPEEAAKQREREVRLKARQDLDGVVVHVMSQYMGKRVHVGDTSMQRQFAFLAELFCKYYAGSDVQDESKSRSQIQAFDLRTHGILTRAEKLVICTPLKADHSDLQEAGETLRELHEESQKASTCLIRDWIECLKDREEYNNHLSDLIRLVWQSLCTTVLARKVRTEEDLDDGTFTTIHRGQLEGEFKRLGMADLEAQEDSCRRMCGILKSRIRDLKRIFAFYAASGDGPAEGMDHAEFWRFIKDCKLQKDRQAMPSVRVDLIFQQSNQDLTLQGTDRLHSDDGQMNPHEWVESLARLAAYRYQKGHLDERLKKMMSEDVLPNACSVNTDVFRERLAGDRVQNVYQKHRRNLKIIYKTFAAEDNSDQGALAQDTMNATELVSFCRDMKLIGPLLSEKAVRTLFTYVQQEEEQADGDENVDVGDSEMVFAEFTEALGAIAAYMRPDPYNVMDVRIDDFLKNQLIATARTLPKLKGKGIR